MLALYLLLRLLTFPLAFLPYPLLHALGRALGSLAFHLLPHFRKRALSNLTLAKALHLSTQEVENIAKGSFQNLMITCLEYPKLSREKKISRIAICENPKKAEELIALGKGIVFFVGHQANWELLFLEGTSRMPGVAIGRPIKNRYLYAWVKKIREKFGGTIVPPKNGIKEGLKALKQGKFMGIVGDQGMPDSGFSSPFLGRSAFTSPIPAMLAYKTASPLIVATTRREKGKYLITYSDPLFPDTNIPMKEETERLMKEVLTLFEESITQRPHEWLWIHNRWKQQTLERIKRPYRHDSIAVFLPPNPIHLQELPRLRSLYPTEDLTLFLPRSLVGPLPIDAHICPYQEEKELLLDDYRFKLIFNLTNNRKIERHYKKRAALTISHPQSIQEIEQLCLRTDSI